MLSFSFDGVAVAGCRQYWPRRGLAAPTNLVLAVQSEDSVELWEIESRDVIPALLPHIEFASGHNVLAIAP